MTKTLVLDTNVFLTEAQSLFSFGDSNIAIPTIVLDEIDKHKHRQDTAGFNARSMNRILDSFRAQEKCLLHNMIHAIFQQVWKQKIQTIR